MGLFEWKILASRGDWEKVRMDGDHLLLQVSEIVCYLMALQGCSQELLHENHPVLGQSFVPQLQDSLPESNHPQGRISNLMLKYSREGDFHFLKTKKGYFCQ